MLDRIKKVSESFLVICLIIALPIELIYLGYNRVQLTSKSFEEISLLNNEIKKLEPLSEEIFLDKENFIFTINKYISPQIFKKYYFLESYISRNEVIVKYKPKLDELRKVGISEEVLISLSEKEFFDSKSIATQLKKLPIDNIDLHFTYYYEHDVYSVYKTANITSLIINQELVEKLRSIKDNPYQSNEEFEQALRETIGVPAFKKYARFIYSTLDRTTYWQKIMLYLFIFIFVLSGISRIVIAFILREHRKEIESNEIEDKIDKAKQNISEKPKDITPVWDLAYYTLQKYYNKNLSQINSIYKLSIAVMTLGFLLIISILITTIYFQIEVRLESIGIIAGIITEFIGATFLFVYKSTIKQALQHSKSLEDINKLGMSIKIIESITESEMNKEKINDAKIKIAKKLITTHKTI